jgi:hypothetical protein
VYGLDGVEPSCRLAHGQSVGGWWRENACTSRLAPHASRDLHSGRSAEGWKSWRWPNEGSKRATRGPTSPSKALLVFGEQTGGPPSQNLWRHLLLDVSSCRDWLTTSLAPRTMAMHRQYACWPGSSAAHNTNRPPSLQLASVGLWFGRPIRPARV